MLYRDELVSVSVLFRLGAQLEEALSKRVWLKSGAFLVIEYTEAMTVVDVNSGKCEKHSGDDFILDINKEAGEEIIRQAVLRALTRRPAPSSCPVRIPAALPSDINTVLKTWAIVLQIFIAAIAPNPHME